MIETTVEAAQTNLPQLLEQVRNGEEILIEENGKPLARIVAAEKVETAEYNPNWFGTDEGKGWIAPDFNETSEEIIDSFYNDKQ